MKKVAFLVIGLSTIGSMSFAQTPPIVPIPAPQVIIAGGLGGAGLGLALLPLLLVAALGGGGTTAAATTTH